MREDISSLMDSEFQADRESENERSGTLLERMARDEEARDTWATYHLIGDALRGDGDHRPGMQSRIFARLAEEPTVLAPRVARFPSLRSARVGMAVAASVATLSVVAWMARQEAPQSLVHLDSLVQKVTAIAGAQTPIAQAPVESAPGLDVQPVNLNEYLQAHEEFSPYTGGYRLANVTSVAPASSVAPVNGAGR